MEDSPMTFVRMLRSFFPSSAPGKTSKPAARPTFRPALEGLEAREVLSSPASLAAPDLGPALTAPLAQPAASTFPLSFTGVTVQNGQLLAQGLIGSLPFTAPIQLSAAPASGTTTILDLHLNAIHLDVLGLKVDTSDICLQITATPGSGNLLGNLLSNVAGLLNNGTPLGTILGGLSAADLSSLTGGLTSLLNGALGSLAETSGSGQHGQTTNLVHVSLGPVDLNLLGLGVHLDNCNNGPVTVDVSAQRGGGNLLGNLLSSVAHLLDRNPLGGSLLTGLVNEILNIL